MLFFRLPSRPPLPRSLFPHKTAHACTLSLLPTPFFHCHTPSITLMETRTHAILSLPLWLALLTPAALLSAPLLLSFFHTPSPIFGPSSCAVLAFLSISLFLSLALPHNPLCFKSCFYNRSALDLTALAVLVVVVRPVVSSWTTTRPRETRSSISW